MNGRVVGFSYTAILALNFFLPAALMAQPMENERPLKPARGEFDAVGKAIVELLQTRDSKRFATSMAASAEDFQSLVTPNLSSQERDLLGSLGNSSGYGRQRLEASAKALLAQADALHLDFSTNQLNFIINAPPRLETLYYSNSSGHGLSLPYVRQLTVELDVGGKSPSSGNSFQLVVRGLQKFRGGWRIQNGLQWTSFPANVADAGTMRKLDLLDRIAGYKSISDREDPGLRTLANALVRFVKTGDTNVLIKDALVTSDMVWEMFQKSGRKGPTRKEVDDEIGKQDQQQMATARKAIELMAEAGIDLSHADIQVKEASLKSCQQEGAPGTLDDLIGQQFTVTMSVQTDVKAKNGTPLSGDYVLAVARITKMGNDWRIMDDLHWESLPKGVVDAGTAAGMRFENYVAEHGTLPPHTQAPDIKFITLTGGRQMKLSDFRGKVILLDFWATWCGPCQAPMASLQTIRKDHPDWGDNVAIVPVSIDDTIGIVRKHVDQRGWTNTVNVWAGRGGWRSAPARAFRVNAVPTTYVIDAHGKIAWAGYPMEPMLSGAVDSALTQ